MSFIQILAALLTPMIAIVTTYIAIQQYRGGTLKLRHDFTIGFQRIPPKRWPRLPGDFITGTRIRQNSTGRSMADGEPKSRLNVELARLLGKPEPPGPK